MGVCSLGQGDPLEKAVATHSSNLAWRIPWTEEPGGTPWGHTESGRTEQLQVHGVTESDTTEQLTLLHTQVII